MTTSFHVLKDDDLEKLSGGKAYGYVYQTGYGYVPISETQAEIGRGFLAGIGEWFVGD
ncbi:hypothetical protein [Lactiplantibacillus paraplantarum]|uniref:hypothetical protein n=1 Tax=Lactiplantibacillus paraplantarum TaxID=60520 RepID=UPI0023AAA8FC|nr:hypothetical protein [Lactiplantibacillus paraplantarum]WEE35640.1 hypothetical protein PWO93_13215 [Lactiplantibacillus paraplantarum]